MDNNELLMIVLAFVVGYMASNMMKSMCSGRLVEGMNQSNCINTCYEDMSSNMKTIQDLYWGYTIDKDTYNTKYDNLSDTYNTCTTNCDNQ